MEGEDEKPRIQVEYLGETKFFHAEEISAMVLSYMKETAETFVGKPIKNAVVFRFIRGVITPPAV